MLNVNRNGPNLVLLGSSDNDRRFCARKYQKKKNKEKYQANSAHGFAIHTNLLGHFFQRAEIAVFKNYS
jgi:hypothetical protein